MSTFTFKPKVVQDSRYVIIIAPHHLKERIWQLLDCASDIVRRVRFDIPEHSHTQIKLEPLPGYDLHQTYMIGVIFTFLGLLEQPLLEIIEGYSIIDPDTIMSRVEGTEGYPDPTHKEIKSILGLYLAYAIYWHLSKNADTFQRQRMEGLNHLEAVNDQRLDALNSFRRLQFDSSLASEAKQVWLEQAAKLLESLEDSQNLVKTAIRCLKVYEKNANDLIASFKPTLDGIEDWPASKLVARWMAARESIDELEVRILNELDNVKRSRWQAGADYRAILEITPEPPPTPIVKN